MGPGTHARRIAGTWLVGAATAIVILGASIAPFLAPPVVRFEQDRTGAGAATGYHPVELDTVAGRLIGDLVLFPQQFWSEVAIAVGGGVIAASIAVAVLAERGAGRAAAAGAAGATSTAAA